MVLPRGKRKRFEIRRTSKKEFYWRIIDCNGKVLCHSETIKRRGDCLKTIKSIMGTKWKDSDIQDLTEIKKGEKDD